ncbi:MAG TPA: hypothetical protein VHY08_01995 [Bacillota bacterium]|nr:hypothetical protein [Bacillota bacterium]
MNKIYRKRRQLLTQLLKDNFGNEIKIQSNEAGLHLEVIFLE